MEGGTVSLVCPSKSEKIVIGSMGAISLGIIATIAGVILYSLWEKNQKKS